VVYLEKSEQPGTVIVDTGGRMLYYVLPGNQAYAYPISVGREGFTWTGTERISRIASWPSWTPPPEMRQRQPGLPITVSGGLINPLGAKALYLGNTIYRIHGTNNERSIGRASSSGCFRMTNEHVTHLATLARVGTVVRVVANYSGVSTSPPLSSLLSGFSLFGDDEPSPKKRKAK
jgi:lipoprotein-anchoring transpeptidase ErfK/SrfK